jgi:chemotaxis signal transduction protein
MNAASTHAQSFVLFPLGERRFALPTGDVLELSRPGRVQEFPHTTPGLDGVLVRRGRILPVWDVARTLLGSNALVYKLYLLAWRKFDAARECTAIQVSGECQLVHGEMQPPSDQQPAYVRGSLWVEAESVQVLDLEMLAAAQHADGSQPRGAVAGKEKP